jgi:hypothetical protein
MNETSPATPTAPDRSSRSVGHDEAALRAWFESLDAYHDIPFMEDGREQPPMPPPDVWFDD